MARWRPDPTFYPTPRMAMGAPAEELAYVALPAPERDGETDAIGVADVDPASPEYGRLVGRVAVGRVRRLNPIVGHVHERAPALLACASPLVLVAEIAVSASRAPGQGVTKTDGNVRQKGCGAPFHQQ